MPSIKYDPALSIVRCEWHLQPAPSNMGWSARPSYAGSPWCDAQPSCCRTIPGRTTEMPAFEHAILRGLDKHGHAGDKKTSKGWWKRYGVVSMHDAVLARLRNNNFEVGFLSPAAGLLCPAVGRPLRVLVDVPATAQPRVPARQSGVALVAVCPGVLLSIHNGVQKPAGATTS